MPLAVPFTCQMTMELVPPESDAWNCCSVTTFTETVAGEIVMLMFVTGSVHVDVDVVLVEVDVVLVQVMAVLAGAAPQEVSARVAINAARGAITENSTADRDAGEAAGDARARLAEGTSLGLARLRSEENFKFEISNLKFQTQKPTNPPAN